MKIVKLQNVLIVLLFALNTFAQSSPDEKIFTLPPGQNKDIKIIERSCLEFTEDYLTRLFVMGQSLAWTLPKGTKYIVEADEYHIENPGPSILDFVLLPVSMCRQVSEIVDMDKSASNLFLNHGHAAWTSASNFESSQKERNFRWY